MTPEERRALEVAVELARRTTQNLPPPATAPEESLTRGRARAFSQGATFGFQDELTGMLGAAASVVDPRIATFGGQGPGAVYRDIQQAEQAAQQQFAEQRPGENLALQVAGGVLNPASRALVGMNPITAGATAGAVTGAGNAPGTGIMDAAGGAALGAASGAVVGGAMMGGQQLYNYLKPDAQRVLSGIAKSTGLSPPQVAERLRAFGPAGTLADIDRGFRDAAGTAAAKLGIAKQRIAAYERRSEQAFGRLMQPIVRSLGGRAQGVQTEAQLRAVLEQQASPLYQQAFQQPVQMTQRLRDIFSRPSVQAAWRKTQSVGADDLQVPLEQLKSGKLPSFQGWQYMTELLYDRQAALYKAGANKQARLVGQLRRELLAELDAQSPAFQQARQLWASAKSAEDAIALGQKFTTDSLDTVLDAVQSLDPADLPFYRLGVGRAIQSKLETVQSNADISRSMRNPAFVAKLRTVMGDDQLAFDFLNSVRVEQEFQKTFNQLASQSATFGRQQMAQQLGGSPIVGEVVDASRGSMMETAQRLLRSATGPREQVVQRIGALLTSADPAEQQVAIRLMEQPRVLEELTGPAASRLYFLLGQQAANVRNR